MSDVLKIGAPPASLDRILDRTVDRCEALPLILSDCIAHFISRIAAV
ncbi:hypothetical protein [Cupriavidus pauculus]|nr:hypothetical protein [Cupriavidus pauculus]